MTAHNLEDVLFLEKLGFQRVVLSRELSLNEIKNITSPVSYTHLDVYKRQTLYCSGTQETYVISRKQNSICGVVF